MTTGVAHRLILVGAVLCASACSKSGPQTVKVSGEAMGTTWSVKVVSPGGSDDAESRVRLACEQIRIIDELMSTYKVDSEVSVFNRAPPGLPVPLSHHTVAVLSQAVEISDLSAGALDVTMAPVLRAWGFGAGASSAAPPSEEEIEKLLAITGHRFLGLDQEDSTLTKFLPDLTIDLSAVAKGYAVDCVAEALVGAGFRSYLVEVGGELRVAGGDADGAPWRLGVEFPRDAGRSVHSVVPLVEGSMATSGDYRNFYELGENRASHIIDPRSGRPISHRLASVTVIDVRCARADALATALMVLGLERGFALAGEKGIAALFLLREASGEIRAISTPEFSKIAE